MARQALIIIDMQRGSFDAAPRHDAEGLVRRLNGLAARMRRRGDAVVWVQHEGPPGDPFHPSAPGFALLAGLDADPGDRFVRKASCDAFLGTALAGLLAEAGAERLVVTGCATDFCVDTTVRSALGRGHATLVPVDGHTTADRPHLAATRIIEHHNAIWAEFISPAGPALACRCDEIAAEG